MERKVCSGLIISLGNDEVNAEEKRKNCLKMEILKASGKPDRILMKNVVYEIEQLRHHCKYDGNRPLTLFYKQSPSGEEVFDLPYLTIHWESREISLLPDKIICDAVYNQEFKLESVVCKSVWKDKKQPVPFNDWLEKIKEKVQEFKKLKEKIEPLEKEVSNLRKQEITIENELLKFEFMRKHLYCGSK